MDRNSIVGLILIAVILVVFSIFNAPSAEEQAKMALQRDSIAKVELAKKEAQAKTDSSKTKVVPVISAADTLLVTNDTLLSDSLVAVRDSLVKMQEITSANEQYGIFSAAAKGEGKKYVIENEKIKITLNSHGGKVSSVELKNYESYKDYMDKDNQIPLKLFDEDSTTFEINFFLNDVAIHSTDLFAETSAPETQIANGNDSIAVLFKIATTDPNKYIEIIYSLKGDSYMMDMKVNVVGLEKENIASSLEFNWVSKLFATEKLIDNERMVSSVFFQYDGDGRDYLSETSSEKSMLERPTTWIAFKQSYFSAAVMSDKPLEYNGSEIGIEMLTSEKYIKEYTARINIAKDNASKVSVPLKFYFGPNDYHELAAVGNGMEGIVNLGWGIFKWVNQLLVIPVFNLLESMSLGYGIIILILTIIVKILILPLTYKNYKSSAKMRVLKPEVEELTKKFTDDPMKKQQETMALYRRSGVNPMAGCIPMLIQMPVLIAVFRFFPSAIQLRQQSFLWAEDLSGYDSVLQLGFSIPLYGDHVSLFTLLMCVSTIFITKMNSGQMDNGMPGMKFMMYFFPIMMIFFFNSFAAGLTYYYLISNLISILIMWGIKKYFIDEQKILAQIHENRKNPKASKKSAFMQRLEDAQKQRAQQIQGKKKK